jgi:arabinan endo-1,5-alpha-L-arabinosidase
MTYGSYWTGIKQRQIDPVNGKLLSANSTIYSLAMRPAVQSDPIEGSSLVHKGNYYWHFLTGSEIAIRRVCDLFSEDFSLTKV